MCDMTLILILSPTLQSPSWGCRLRSHFEARWETLMYWTQLLTWMIKTIACITGNIRSIRVRTDRILLSRPCHHSSPATLECLCVLSFCLFILTDHYPCGLWTNAAIAAAFATGMIMVLNSFPGLVIRCYYITSKYPSIITLTLSGQDYIKICSSGSCYKEITLNYRSAFIIFYNVSPFTGLYF